MVEKPRLVGRERELDELARFLDAVPAGPVGLLFEGDAGIGKTTLWREAVLEALDGARAEGETGLSNRCGLHRSNNC
jgi:predicted ATPase